MNVVHEIAEWSKKAAKWQSDAIRRIFTQDSLSATDEDELLRLLLAEHHIKEGDQPPPIPVPFADLVSDSSGTLKKILLKEIHSVSGVNALVADQAINFALDGVTVIYGENGAGKSGYTRIFKHACHAREKGAAILPNVAAKTKGKAKATIELSVDGQDIAVQWAAGAPASELLAEIAVFDSHCARVFLDQANEVVYLPFGMDVFGRLASVCMTLRAKIQEKLAAIPSSYAARDQFRASTRAGALVHSLSDKTDIAQLEKLGRLSDDEQLRLTTLKGIVAAAKVNPARQRAAELRRSKLRIEQFRTKVLAIDAALSTVSATTLRQLFDTATAAAEAARIASTEAFKADPLTGTGSDPWKRLFLAAKAFSETAAYRDEDFPVTRTDAHCLLCQQPLTPDAADRFIRFQQFIVDDSAKKKQSADEALAAAVIALKGVTVQPFPPEDPFLEELKSHNAALAENVQIYMNNQSNRKNALLKAAGDGSWDDVPELHLSLAAELKKAADTIEATAVELDKADIPEEMKKLQDELAELEDRELLGKQETQIKTYIVLKLREVLLKLCERACDTGQITRFNSELMEKAVTDQLIGALNKEIDFFGVKCVPVQVSKKGEKGKTKHQLTIATGAPPSGVLSEGEQRVVAIAAFLAELETAGRNLPIIFDDPVSSLDHLYRDRVAKRFAAEGKDKRQVVVFTHDIVMLLALERECAEQRVPLLIHTVRRSAAGPGECPGPAGRPWHASSTKQRIGFVKDASSGFKKLSEQSPEAYRTAVAEVFGKLREAWERAIEEWLLNDAVQRFRPSIETQRLKKVVIESADYAAIDVGMSKCSAELTGHDSAAAKAPPTPSPEDVAGAINELETFVATIKKRHEAAAKAADELIDPPQPAVATSRATTIIQLDTTTTVSA